MQRPDSTTPALPASCTGDCDNGSRDCTCGGAIGMWDDERDHPRMAVALYLGAFAAGIVAIIAGAVLGSAA